MNEKIFKAYDIRGVYPEELNTKTAYSIGRALVQYTGAKKIAIGWDMRESSETLMQALREGINAEGVGVVRIGMATTPMLYYATSKLAVDAGVIVTASHNPAEYNGFKLCKKGAVPIGEGSGMEEIRDIAVKGNFVDGEKIGATEENLEIKDEYINYITSFFKTGMGKKRVVIDFANSMGIVDKEVYEKISSDVEAINMYDNLDGSFPNHEANPLKLETLGDLQRKVVEENADLGIAYDGDADRVGFVDENGSIVPMDFVIALIAKEVLKKYPGGLVLVDLRSSNSVKEFIEEAGGQVHRCRVGHSLIKGQMRREGAIFAGELSGHYFFEENSKAEMATLAVVMILNLLNETGKKMSELTTDLQRYYHSGEINSEVADKQKAFRMLKEKYCDGKLDELDGIRIDFPDWWFNVRASNTEPVMRLNLEAKTKVLMEEKRDELLELIIK